MVSLIKGWAAQSAICRALGIDPNVTSRVVIDMPSDGPTLLRITQFMTTEQAIAIERVFTLTGWTEEEAH